MLKRTLITGFVLIAAATPAFALYCEDDRGGVSITFGSNLDTGGGYTESELNNLDLMPLTYRWSSRFIFLDAEEARQKLERTR